MGNVKAVTKESWDAEVLQAKGLVITDFWAEWCGPCRLVSPIVDELAKEYTGRVKIMKLNTDENPEVAGRYQIMGIPTLLFFKDGKAVDKLVGALSKTQYKEKIENLLKG
ncbi:MAG: thioredoxin [Nitrospirota bacterium]|nr:thioredoxin [Nitrospirota bacterium]